MGRRAGPPKERRHIHLSVGSWDKLVELYGPQGITPSGVIDQLVTKFLRRVEEKASVKLAKMTQTQPVDEDTDIEITGE